MVKGRVVYVVQNAFSKRDHQRFGAAFLASRGYDVTVLDLADILQPLLTHNRAHYGEFGDIRVIHVPDTRALRRQAEVLAGADLIISSAEGGHLTPRNRPVMAAIGRSGTPWMALSANAYPGWSRHKYENRSGLARLRDLGLRLSTIDPRASLVARLPHGWMGVRPASFNVIGGVKSFRSSFAGPDTRVIRAHAMDYDLFREVRDTHPAQRDIAVFVDEFRPFHPDIKATGVSVPVTADAYYPKLRAVFDRIEADTGLKVVIAACPRADYSGMEELFGAREVHMYKTAQLIGESRLVLGHRSTALSHAVLFRRPILQLATADNYGHVSQRPYFDGYAHALGKPICFYDDPARADLSRAMEMDEAAYDRFVADYIKQPGTPDAPYWQIVLDALDQAGVFAGNK